MRMRNIDQILPLATTKHKKGTKMKKRFSIGIGILTMIGMIVPGTVRAEEEFEQKVPEAKGYTVIYKANPREYAANGYTVDNSLSYTGDLKRIAYYLKTVDKEGKESWVCVLMDPFEQDLELIGIPQQGAPALQKYVTNMEVFSNVPGVKTGKFEKGNIEFWATNYGGWNKAKIPGATGKYDFGDAPDTRGDYGSMQIHNYLEKQTVFAFNMFRGGPNSDIGIGNNPKGHPDWTFSRSANNLKSAEIVVAGKFENLKKKNVVPVNPDLITFTGRTKKAFYAENEPMKFVFTVDFGKQPVPEKPWFVKWTRTGDDGKRENGKIEIVPGKPAVVTTSTAAPGFVRIQATLLNAKGFAANQKGKNGRKKLINFDGGAGVSPEKLQSAAEEPADFDAFWDRQKAKLAKVPVKYTMTKVSKPGAKVEVYAVSVDCAGPRPVTGYLTIPAGAKEKSLPATVVYQGYGTHYQQPPKWGPKNMIRFDVNAHGYDLGKDAAYTKKFFDSIKSNGKGYAFDPKQNSDPETAYFNGMALRVMRSLQFVKTLPQWNGKNLTVSGGSQGGLQTIWAAALDPDVTAANSGITWCCDFAGPDLKKRLKGWRPSYVPALNYYDSVFHAKRIKCPVVITRAGLGDYVCPPSGLAILYNNLKAPKKILWYQGSTHGFVPKDPQKFVVEEKKK